MADPQPPASPLPVSQGPRSVIALFGEDGDSMPLWFNKSTFMAPDFSAEAYIADLRKFVPLDTLRAELRSHLRLLKSELVELINRDYADFVNLSTKLVDVEGAVLRMRLPLNDLRGRLSVCKGSINSSLLELQDRLKKRAEALEAREILELLLDTSHVLSKIEKLLVELKAMPEERSGISQGGDIVTNSFSNGEPADAGGSLEESRSRLLERIASEMNRLKFSVARVQDLPFIQNMEKRIQSANLSLDASLQKCFETGLERHDEAVIFHCLRAYAAIDNTSGAHEVFRVFVVAPIMKHIFLSKDSDDSQDDLLEDNLVVLQEHIQSDCKFLLDIAVSANSGVQSFNFLSDSILEELHVAIQKWKPGAFSPGKPSIFLTNYRSILGFLDFLEGHCLSKSAISTFRSQPAHTSFLKQWNLGVYFTLRFQDIAGTLEEALAVTTLGRVSNVEEDALCLSLEPSRVLLQCLKRCWQNDVFIIFLSDKFLGLTLQLISRYSTWLLAGLAARKSGNGGNGTEWALGAMPEDFILVKHDIELLTDMLKDSFVEDICKLLESGSMELHSLVQRSIRQGADQLTSVIPTVSEVLSDILVRKCVEIVTQVRGITTTYRMTNKPLPVRHSSYVTSILQPVKVFLEGEYATFLSTEDKNQLVATIVERVTYRYDELARDIITAARKFDLSLHRFRQGVQKKSSAGMDSGESNISDTDKICKQLFLDILEFGRQLQSLGMNMEELRAYISLWQCVAPPDKQGKIML